MNATTYQPKNVIERIFMNEHIILAFVTLNAVVIFMQGFPNTSFQKPLSWVDNGISILFLMEMLVKMRALGMGGYFRDGWNRFDALLVMLSLPSILMLFVPLENFVDLGFLLVCRIFRVFKFFRFVRFFPQVEHIFRSVQRAMKSSIMVLIGFFVVIFIMSILCCFFFQGINPEVDAMFGNPLRSYYTTFQVFTIEGWNSVPAELCTKANFDDTTAFFVKVFFAGLFIIGGVFGLSIVNSLFVDAMVNDEAIKEDTEDIQAKAQEIDTQTEKIEQYILQLQQQISTLTQEVQSLKQK